MIGIVLAIGGWTGEVASAETLPAVADANPHRIQIGWDGHLVLGAWTLVSAEVAVLEVGEYRLVVSATDPDGNLAKFPGPQVRLEPGTHRLYGRCQLGRDDGQILVRVDRDNAPWMDLTGKTSVIARMPHRQSERLLITVGLPADVQSVFPAARLGQPTVVHLPDSSLLPSDDLAYDGVTGLLLTGKELPNEAQSAALERWVRRGGRLYISIGMTPADFRETPLARRLPLDVAAEPVSTRELTALESFAGMSVRIVPTGQRVLLPKITYSYGRSLAGNRTDPVLVQVPLSFGAVTVLGMDVTQPPLKAWPGLGALLRKTTDVAEPESAPASRSQQLGSLGVTDMASQIAAALEDFDAVSRTSPWWVLGGLFVLLGLIGPLDYWLVDRVWRKPLATWISFPLFLTLGAALAVWAAGATNGGRTLLNRLDVVDVDATSEYARGRHWLTLYSTESRTNRLECRPAWPAWSRPAAETPRLMLGWAGLPESGFGGMYRSGAAGFQFGRLEYLVSSDAGDIIGLPTAQWSTAAFVAQSDGPCRGLVEAKLVSSPTGRLSGTVLHRLPGALTDWFLAYENRIYRLPGTEGADSVGPLPPQRVFRVDQRAVVQRELRGYLTRTTARQAGRAGVTSGSGQIVMQQDDYDPTSRDLGRILPLLSFHAEVDGTTYTRLRNDVLADLDLTPLLRLDRAVLIGFLDVPAAEGTVNADAGLSGRRTTLVRLLLPVERSKQTLRELPKFENQ